MARSAAISVQNNFSRGRITEATGLNFPENAVIDEDNCIFNHNGDVTRRKGFDFESNYTNLSVTRLDTAITEYVWTSVGGTGTTSFVVLQVGTTLYFYETQATSSISASRKTFTQDLTSYFTSGAINPGSKRCEFDSGNGLLFVVHPEMEPIYIEYISSTDTITATQIDLKIRDVEGVEDNLEVDEQPSVITNEHQYNLYNQGWVRTAENNHSNPAGGMTAYQYWVDYGNTDVGNYPSNADVWWLFKNTSEILDRAWFDRIDTGNTPAPKGYYILDAFNQDRSTASGISGLTTTSCSCRPNSVAFFASRVWYAGVDSEGFNNRVYFSQVIEKNSQIGLCHQANDPTSEENADLLATDGGVIVIPEIANVVKLFALESTILIFATNGLWAIAGTEGISFRANDFSVIKVSGIDAINGSNFVDVEGFPMWWNAQGIYTVRPNEVGGNLQVSSLTDRTIDENFYDSIPSISKKTAKGVFDTVKRRVLWLYRSTQSADVDNQLDYDKVLLFDVVSQAFFTWSLPTTSGLPRVNGFVDIKGPTSGTSEEDVTDSSGIVVTDSSSTTVTTNVAIDALDPSEIYYIVTTLSSGITHNLTFAQEEDTRYLDWYTHDSTGTNYTSYGVGGYQIHGDGQRKVYNKYVIVFMKTETDASMRIQGLWDYAQNEASNRYGTLQEAYGTKGTNFSYQKRKLRFRGSGTVFQYRFESTQGKPFTFVGWSLYETQGGRPHR